MLAGVAAPVGGVTKIPWRSAFCTVIFLIVTLFALTTIPLCTPVASMIVLAAVPVTGSDWIVIPALLAGTVFDVPVGLCDSR